MKNDAPPWAQEAALSSGAIPRHPPHSGPSRPPPSGAVRASHGRSRALRPANQVLERAIEDLLTANEVRLLLGVIAL